MRAESDHVAGVGAGGDAGWVIVGIGVGLWAGRLEYPGVGGGLAGLWASEGASAAVPGGVECGAGTLAGHHALPVA